MSTSEQEIREKLKPLVYGERDLDNAMQLVEAYGNQREVAGRIDENRYWVQRGDSTRYNNDTTCSRKYCDGTACDYDHYKPSEEARESHRSRIAFLSIGLGKAKSHKLKKLQAQAKETHE